MKYILPIILIFIGCFEEKKQKPQETKTQQTQISTKTQKKENNLMVISLKDLNLTFKDNSIVYPKKRVIILFRKNSTKCKMQENILKKLNLNFYKTDNIYLKNYFKINIYPTIIILDKNKTLKYEGFIPYEILKAEGF